MTREEALDKIQDASNRLYGPALLDSLIAIGVLKFDQPKTATDRALAALNRQNVAGGGGVLSSKTLCEIMDSAGCRIVDKS
jgi:hypothetical protein